MKVNKDGTPRKKVTHRLGVPVIDYGVAAAECYDALVSEPDLTLQELGDRIPSLDDSDAKDQHTYKAISECRKSLADSGIEVRGRWASRPGSGRKVYVYDLTLVGADPLEDRGWTERRRKYNTTMLPVDIAAWESSAADASTKLRTKAGREQMALAQRQIANLEAARLAQMTEEEIANEVEINS